MIDDISNLIKRFFIKLKTVKFTVINISKEFDTTFFLPLSFIIQSLRDEKVQAPGNSD